jgi:hypothetical protein
VASLRPYFPPEYPLEEELAERDFVLVFDGLSESQLSPDTVKRFVSDPVFKRVTLLVTIRPDARFRDPLVASGRCTLLEPQRLDESTLQVFVRTYLPQPVSDAERDQQLAAIRRVCRSPDGTYLPVLVRLALVVGPSDAASVAEIYEGTFRRLLKSKEANEHEVDAILIQTSTLCASTYAMSGTRTLPMRFVTDLDQRELLRKLLIAQIVVSADPTPSSKAGLDPREVRFFHDSMQSFLAARGLMARADWAVQLFAAAGRPEFQAKSDLGARGSELFEMCLQTSASLAAVRDALLSQLRSWCLRFAGDLSLNDVMGAAPFELKAALAVEEGIDITPSALLARAIDLAAEGESAGSVSLSAALYSGLAPRLWRLV